MTEGKVRRADGGTKGAGDWIPKGAIWNGR